MNDQINASPPNSKAKKHGPVQEPSDLVIECWIGAIEFYIACRHEPHAVGDLADLWCKTVTLIESLKANLPERIGSKDKKDENIGWNIKKIHDMLHKVSCMRYRPVIGLNL